MNSVHGMHQHPAAEQLVAGDQPQIDRHEGQPRARRRRNAGVEAGRLVRLVVGVDPRVEPRQAQRAADRERQRGDPAELAARPAATTGRGSAPARCRRRYCRTGCRARRRTCCWREAAGRCGRRCRRARRRRRSQPSAFSHSPPIAKRTPVRPKHSASAVIALGTSARNGMPRAGRSSIARSLADARTLRILRR